MKVDQIIETKVRNPVAKAAQRVAKGSGAHKDKKRAAKQGDVKHKKQEVAETATAGATSAGNIATVTAPQLSPGKARGKKSYLGSPATGSGTKAPPQPKVIQPKSQGGVAKNALDMKGANIFGAAIKR